MPWRAIADRMWKGHTLKQACRLIELDYIDMLAELNVEPEIKRYLVDVSMVASAREEILNASNTA